MKKYLILGVGMQGQAITHALKTLSTPEEVLTADIRAGIADIVLDVKDKNALKSALKQVKGGVVVSAISYTLNEYLSQECIKAGVSFVDLGGNTEVVLKQHQLHQKAIKAGVVISPDNGLQPGMGNILAGNIIRKAKKKLESIKIYCGGLPQKPIGPLGYKLVFNPEGLINEYYGPTTFILEGQLKEVEAFTACIPFKPQQSTEYHYESFFTSGGVSTSPQSFLGKLNQYSYRTVRYEGHFQKMELLKDFGWFEGPMRKEVESAIARTCHFPDILDKVILEVHADLGDGKGLKPKYTLYHNQGKFTAMAETTGYSAAVVAFMIGEKMIAPGVQAVELTVDEGPYLKYLKQLGVQINTPKS
ncbi:MAG: saccharopine dehydrogenase C-terminal domain-containing protein [Planctomycetota bacterium]